MIRFSSCAKYIVFSIIILGIGVILYFLFNISRNKRTFFLGKRYSYIEEKSKQLDFNADKILSFVKNEIRYEKYNGCLRGTVGTLWSKAGNDIDKCSLAIELLKYAGVDTKLLKGGNEYFIGYKKDKDWISFCPVSEAKEEKFEVLKDIPDIIKHKLEIIVRCYYNGSNYEDDIIYKNDTAFFINRKNVLEFKKKMFGRGKVVPCLICGDEIIQGKGNIEKIKKLVLIFNIYSPNKEKQVYQRTIFDINREVGHRIGKIKDKYVFIVLPNFIDRNILEKESRIFRSNKEKMPIDDEIVFKNHLLCMSFAVISDINTKKILRNTNGKGYFTSPRIIIASREFEMIGGKEMPNQSLDLLKNNIALFSPDYKKINTMRGIGDNVIEGMVLDIFTNQKCITTTHLFNELYKENYGYEDSTFSKRVSLYLHNLQKIVSENKDVILTISSGGYSVKIKNCFPGVEKSEKELSVLFAEDEKVVLEKNFPKKLAFVRDKDKNIYYVNYRKESIEDLSFLIEDIFMRGFQLGLNYEPVIAKTKEILETEKLKITNTNKIVYSLTVDNKEHKLTAYLRRKKGNKFNMDWVVEHGRIMGSAKVRYPVKYIFRIDDVMFEKDFSGIKKIAFGIEDYMIEDRENMKVSENYEDYEIVYNGKSIVVETMVLKDNKDTKIWIFNDKKSYLVLKLESTNYKHEIKSITNGEVDNILCGKVSDEKSKKGINNVTVSLLKTKLFVTTWGDGSFEINFNEPVNLIDNSVILFLDNSGSMGDTLKNNPKSSTKTELAQKAAFNLLENLPQKTEIMYCNFLGGNPFSVDKERVKKDISNTIGGAGTPLTTSVYNVLQSMDKGALGKNQKIILLSDGKNVEKKETMAEAYKKSNYKVPFYTLGFDIEAGSKAEEELKEIADISGGKYVRAENLKELKKAFFEFSKPIVEENNDTINISVEGYEEVHQEIFLDRKYESLEFSLKRKNIKTEEEGKKVIIFLKENLTKLEDLKIRKQAKELVSKAVLTNEDIRVILPTEMIDYNFVHTIGWWELNVRTGELVGRTEDGLYGAATMAGALVAATGHSAGKIAVTMGQNIDGANGLRKYGSFIAGMYCQSAGMLGAVIEEIDMEREGGCISISKWVEYVDKYAFVFSEDFLTEMGTIYDKESFRKGIKCVSNTFKKGDTSLFLEKLIDFSPVPVLMKKK